jgi:hypothetical protein
VSFVRSIIWPLLKYALCIAAGLGVIEYTERVLAPACLHGLGGGTVALLLVKVGGALGLSALCVTFVQFVERKKNDAPVRGWLIFSTVLFNGFLRSETSAAGLRWLEETVLAVAVGAVFLIEFRRGRMQHLPAATEGRT